MHTAPEPVPIEPGTESGSSRAGPGWGTGPADLAAAQLERVTNSLPTGEVRPQQVAMCRAVADGVATGRHLVVQAGTGTGKSLAYTVPAVVSGKKVVVATATKALQDQLARKDLPIVAAALDNGFSFAVLKGRSNYLCRQRAVEMGGRGSDQHLSAEASGEPAEPAGEPAPGAQMPDLADLTAVDPAGGTGADTALPGDDGGDRLVDQVRMLLRWAEETDTGDRADLPFEPHPRAWAMLSVGPRECPGAFRCPSGERCFSEQARSAAAEADVVVVNTHLYGAHLASGSAVLPEHDVVVFDEAHEVEGVMTASLGAEITPGRFHALQAMARPLVKGDDGGTALGGLAEVADRLQRVLESRVGTRVLREPGNGNGSDDRAGDVDRARGDDRAGDAGPAGWERSLPGPAPSVVPAASTTPQEDLDLTRLLELASSRVERLSALLRRDRHEPTSVDIDDGGGRQARALSAAGHLSDDLGRIAGRTAGEVAWVDGTSRAPVLRLSPIDVGPPLAELLWGEVTAVLTSATIPLQLTERLGLDGFAVDKMDVGSPFDYRSHALLYVARHLPDRRRAESEPALQEELEALITAAGGRTLALFTSRRATEAAASALRTRLPYRLLVQGKLPKGLLLAAFAEEESSCLFATLGFWQGVDVPGRSLSLVTLDRLPFARPNDPLLEARRERAGDDAFRLVDLPRAATLLAQGTGRLIRSADDYGVVAVLDPRLATAGYRRVLLAGLPPMRRTTDRRQVEEFLSRILTDPQ